VLMTAPLFSNRSVPAMVKIGFAALLAMILLPFPATSGGAVAPQPPTELLGFTLAVAQEVFMGVMIGFVANLVFLSIEIAANMMGLQAGFTAATLFNPFTNASSSALDQFYTLIALTLFLAVNGHHMLIITLARTFQLVPPGTFVFTQLSLDRLLYIFNQTFIIGVNLALPVVGTLLLTDVGLGLLARVVPQIQVFFVGLPLKVGLGFFTLAMTMVITLPVVRDTFSNITRNILAIAAP